jgi:hypothetical protein
MQEAFFLATLTFGEEVWLRVIESGVIGGLLALAGFRISRALSDLESRQALQNELERSRSNTALDFRGRQLAEFFWPLYFHLEKDNAVWRRVLDRAHDDELKRHIAFQIEQAVILPNHDEAVRLIESKIYFAGGDEGLLNELTNYVRHVAVYKAIRASGRYDIDPIFVEEPWPKGLFPLVERRTREAQRQYDALLKTSVAGNL